MEVGGIEVIKATSVEELTPESGQPAVRRGISLEGEFRGRGRLFPA